MPVARSVPGVVTPAAPPPPRTAIARMLGESTTLLKTMLSWRSVTTTLLKVYVRAPKAPALV